MGWIQDKVSPYPTVGNNSEWDPLCVFAFRGVFLWTDWSAAAAAHLPQRPPQERPAKAASLQQAHFAHWLVSWVLCDCNWLESLKLASPCQPWKLWNHKAWSSYQACWSLMAGRIRAPEWWTCRPQAGSQTPFSRPPRAWSQMGALSRAFSFPSVKAVSGWTDFGLIEVGGIGKWEQMGRRVK